MLTKVLKLCIFAFLIALPARGVCGKANGYAPALPYPSTSPTLQPQWLPSTVATTTADAYESTAAAVEAEFITTTTTLASSYAPPTIANPAAEQQQQRGQVNVYAATTAEWQRQQHNELGRRRPTAVAAMKATETATATTTTATLTTESLATTEVTATTTTDNFASEMPKIAHVATTTTATSNMPAAAATAAHTTAATESRVDVVDQQQQQQQQHSRNGNEAKTAIKNAKEPSQETSEQQQQLTTTTETAAALIVTSPNRAAVDELAQNMAAAAATTTTAENLLLSAGEVGAAPTTTTTTAGETTKALKLKAAKKMQFNSAKDTATEAESTGTADSNTSSSQLAIATTKATTTTDNIDDIHVAGELQTGLDRIKLAEIVNDAFNGLPAAATTTTTTTFTATQMTAYMQPQQEDEEEEEEAAAATRTANKHKWSVELAVEEKDEELLQRAREQQLLQNAAARSKMNIVDLYPMKMEDFKPIIRDSNAKLLKERTIYQADSNNNDNQQNNQDVADNADVANNDVGVADMPLQLQNLLPNEVEVAQPLRETATFGMARRRVNHAPAVISDFTGKLLAEQDGVITEIEQKFRLNEFGGAATPTTAAVAAEAASSSSLMLNSHRVNHKLSTMGNAGLRGGSGGGGVYDFIDRRVKKSYDFPLHHRAASDAMSVPHIDFASTKFNSDNNNNNNNNNGNSKTSAANMASGSAAYAAAATSTTAAGGVASRLSVIPHPEFSTTKFYNSKELYNEMLQHSKLQQQQQLLQKTQPPANATAAAGGGSVYAESSTLQPATKAATITTPTTTTTKMTTATRQPEATTTTKEAAVAAEMAAAAAAAAAASAKAKKYQKELKRAKLLLKAMLPASKATASSSSSSGGSTVTASLTTKASQSLDSSTSVATSNYRNAATFSTLAAIASNTSPNPAITTRTTTTAAVGAVSARPLPQQRFTNPTKSSSQPIARPRILTRLQEKINSLECEIQNVPPDSHLWRGNETHELLLPIMSSGSCHNEEACLDAAPFISWQGEAEIQSGDILIVEINDALLDKHFKNATNFAHNIQVYQVTRSGHEHCDVTEGILLDITPLVVDGRKLVTLYDKDLTEGVNLLIVVSELWGAQCVRLKVTTKTDNCGENADCSGKGVCYSNAVMEEYECQCCSGFAGPHCEEIDACTPSPCTNNGICVDLSQGHEGNSYQCLCPYGYTGKNCQYESDPCNSAECMNGGSCVGNSTHFRCDCTPGFAGPLCQHSLNECESSPCIHGICVDQEDGFRCFCQPGFAGELCNFEYNECESSPCQNGGECIDHIGSYECRCSKGYTGNRCQIKVDFCANKPCPEGHRCIDHGNDYSCECPGGRNGLDCNQMPRTQCNVNPCTHGGTCWSSGDSFYCACRAGFTGTLCEDEFVVETVVSSSEFMVDDTSARNFNDKTFGSSVVLKSPIELHNAYFAAGVLAAAIFIVAIVVTICHCKVNQTYRKFSTRSTTFFPILGFGRRAKSQGKLSKHWLSGKGLGSGAGIGGSANPLRSSSSTASLSRSHHLPAAANGNGQRGAAQQQNGGALCERPFQRHLAMNLENDMYYTVDFSENSQHSPLIQ